MPENQFVSFQCSTPTEGIIVSLNGNGLIVYEFRLFYYLITQFRSGCLSCRRGPPGDLYVYLDVEEIPGIQRDGIDLCSTISVSYIDAILGTVAKVTFSFLRS